MEVKFLGFSFSLTWLLVGAAVILYFLNDLWARSYWARNGIKSPRSIPILGNTLHWAKAGYHFAFLEYNKKFGRIYGVYNCQKPALAVSDLDVLKDIMVKNFGKFYNRQTSPLMSKDMSEALFSLKDDRWKRMRNVLTPTFSAAKMKHMSPLINECAGRLLEHIEKHQEQKGCVDVRELFGAFVMDTIATCAFGLKIDSQVNSDDPFVLHAKKAFGGDLFSHPVLMIINLFPWTTFIFKYLDFNIIDKNSTHFFADVVKKTLAARRSPSNQIGGKKIDYLQLLMDAHDTNNDDNKKIRNGTVDGDQDEEESGDVGPEKKAAKQVKLTEKEVISQALIFFTAGYDTTNTLLGFLAYLLARNQDVQNKLLEEIDEIAPKAEDVGYNVISKMPYLDQVFSETLRIYPPGPMSDRICTEPFKINGFTVPKGMRVHIPIYCIHHDPDMWPDPETFDPDRFSKENREKHHPFAWMPFGAGPRNCIGMRFALMEAKIVVIRVLQKFRLETCPQTEIPPSVGKHGLLSPPNGITLQAIKRT